MDETKERKSHKQRKSSHPDVQPLPLPKGHKCYGCVWYPRDVDILYCPFSDCVRHKKGFGSGEKQTYE